MKIFQAETIFHEKKKKGGRILRKGRGCCLLSNHVYYTAGANIVENVIQTTELVNFPHLLEYGN